MKIIESIDFLGKKPTLLIDKKESHKSFLGGILSLVSIVAVLAGTGYFLSILFARQTFTLVQSEKLDLVQTMSISDFPIGVSISDSLARELPDADRIFEVFPILVAQSSYFDTTLNKTLPFANTTLLKFEKCNFKQNKFVKYKKLLEDADTGRSGYCLPPGIEVNLTSPSGYPTTSLLTIGFARCMNITQIGKTNCYPSDVIEEKLKDVFIGILFVDNYFDHNNLTNPAQAYVRNEVLQAGASSVIFRQLYIEMKNVDYFSDVNYLVTNPEKVEYSIVGKTSERTTTVRQSVVPGAFSLITIEFGSIKEIYERKYYKLQNMLADLGGLVNALITILLNFNLYFSNKTFFNKIIDFNSYSLYIKSIDKSLSENGGEGKQRDIKIIDKKGKTKDSDRNPHDQEGILYKSQ
jgi:hypothetical protein